MFAKRAMLVELTIRQWTARKHDKSASSTVKNAHQVVGDGGKYNKLLIAKEALERMKNQCTVERSRITEALVEDVRDLTQVMDDLNVNEDPELSRITREIRDGLVFQADDLRKSPALRKEAQDRASTILESLSWS